MIKACRVSGIGDRGMIECPTRRSIGSQTHMEPHAEGILWGSMFGGGRVLGCFVDLVSLFAIPNKHPKASPQAT